MPVVAPLAESSITLPSVHPGVTGAAVLLVDWFGGSTRSPLSVIDAFPRSNTSTVMVELGAGDGTSVTGAGRLPGPGLVSTPGAASGGAAGGTGASTVAEVVSVSLTGTRS
jgi:hypothetical protein